jgi:hypothetical protein
MQKKEVGPLSYTYPKINSEWIKDPNVRTKIVKLTEEYIDCFMMLNLAMLSKT